VTAVELDCAEDASPETGSLPARFLLVEDSPSDQRLILEYLVDIGIEQHSVVRVGTLAEARAAMTEKAIDCVLLDLSLSDAVGLEGVAVLAAAAPRVPLVVVTGRPADALVNAAMAAGADEYLCKADLSPALLSDLLRRAVERRRGGRTQRAASAAEIVLDSIEAPTAALDGLGRIIAANHAWTAGATTHAGFDAVGIGANYLTACDQASGLFAEGASEAAAGIRAVLEGRAERFAMDYPRQDGSVTRWFSLRVSPLGERGGGAVVTHLDISELKAAEAQLHREIGGLRSRFDESAPVFAQVGSDWRLRRVSEMARKLLGMREHEPIASWVGRAVDPGDRERMTKALADVATKPGCADRGVVQLLDGSGRSREFELSLVSLIDEDDVVLAITGNDVTAARLQRIASRLESRLLQRLPAAVVVTDDRGFVVYWNDQAASLYGFSRQDALGRRVVELNTGPTGTEIARSIMDSVIETGRWEGEYEARRADGSLVAIQAALERVEEPDIAFYGIVGASIDVSDRRRLEESLAYQALHDQFTGLPNRRLFVEHLEQALARAARLGRHVGIVSIDVDDFKSLNDRFGVEAGDEILRSVARQLAEATRPGDVLARVGGDDFVACLSSLGEPLEAHALAESLLRASSHPVSAKGQSVALTLSAGLAVSSPESQAETLMRDADAALYAAKQAGKGRVHMFDHTLHAEARRRRDLSKDLERALDAGELSAFYQPEVDLVTGELAGFEALARWQHPERGSVPPEQFIPVAEAAGMIDLLTRQMLHNSCSELGSWLAASPGRNLKVAVNISPAQLIDPHLPEMVDTVLAEVGVPARRLCLEVTESALVDAERAAAILHELKEIGVEIAIDDFGTGYSSLSRLHQFPIDYLKIDRSFVNGMTRRKADAVIVTAVIGLARALELRTIAEGIEELGQLELLAAGGCELGQGYLWSRPVPAHEAAELAIPHKAFAHATGSTCPPPSS
jgi:diguanylate cyclase (GGDEF)-like protein/PAS domain S-box-containing protein